MPRVAPEVPTDYSARIRRLRDRIGLTQVEFAQRIGLAEMNEPGHRFATVDAAVRALEC